MPQPRKISRVWSFFTRQSDGNAQCHICGHILSYKSSTTNLAKHLHRKHPSAFSSGDEDPREGLKEFITLEGAESFHDDEDTADAPTKEPTDTEWTPPKKFLRKSAPQVIQKKVKPEVFTASNIEYLIYPSTEQTSRPNRHSAPPAPKSTPVEAKTDEDEFSIFARFLAQRVRTLKDPYWQSCAINEINSALHKVEMRRYEPPKAAIGSDFGVQTDGHEHLMTSQIKSYNSVTSGTSQDPEAMRSSEVVEEIVTSHEVVESVNQSNKRTPQYYTWDYRP